METKDHVRYERDGAVAILTLDRPEKRNSFIPCMSQRLVDLCDRIDADPDIGAAVIRGAGATFCAGADRAVLNEASEDPVREDMFAMLGGTYRSFMRVGSLRVPVIAAVRGSAVGAGLNLALAADVRIIAEDARLIAGFLKIGIHPGGGHFHLMARQAGREAAAAMSIFGEEIDGRRAVSLGLAWEAPPDERVDDRSLAMAHTAAADPTLARLATKSFRGMALPGLDWEVAMEAERSAQMWSLRRRHARAVLAR